MNWIGFYSAVEIKAGAIMAALWAFLNLVLGGIDAPMQALAALMVVDFISGVACACKQQKLNSTIGRAGLWKKVAVFFAVALAYALDLAMGTKLLRGMVISGFAIIEALSILENIDRLGWGKYLPTFISSKIKDIAEKNIGERDDDDAYIRRRKPRKKKEED